VARHGYAVDALFIDTPRQARNYYSQRFGIESSYRLSERSIASTTTQNPAVRFLYVLLSFLLQNAWRYLPWEYVASRAWRATPLVVAVQKIPWNGEKGSGDGARCASRRPRKQATGRPFRTVITDRERPRGEWHHRRVGGGTPPTAIGSVLAVSSRSPQQLLGINFSTELRIQKQSTDGLCGVLKLDYFRSLFRGSVSTARG